MDSTIFQHLRSVWAAATGLHEEGRPITLRALMTKTGITSTSVTDYRVRKLCSMGYLFKDINFDADGIRKAGTLTVIIPLGSYRQSEIIRRRQT